jgi:hypothetical protein
MGNVSIFSNAAISPPVLLMYANKNGKKHRPSSNKLLNAESQVPRKTS